MTRTYTVAIAGLGFEWTGMDQLLECIEDTGLEPGAIHVDGTKQEFAGLQRASNLQGLYLLPTPETLGSRVISGADWVASAARYLTRHARIVILDLPFHRADIVKAACGEAALTVLVVEPTPVALHAAHRLLQTLVSWGVSKDAISAVVVNRNAASVFSVEKIKSQIGLPTCVALPPAAEICLRAESERRPVQLIQPGSLIAQSYLALSEDLENRLSQ